jgi:hypothetical protein
LLLLMMMSFSLLLLFSGCKVVNYLVKRETIVKFHLNVQYNAFFTQNYEEENPKALNTSVMI